MTEPTRADKVRAIAKGIGLGEVTEHQVRADGSIDIHVDRGQLPPSWMRFDPFTRWSDAGMVIEGMQKLGWLFALRYLGSGQVSAGFWLHGTDPRTTEKHGDFVAGTAPEAIGEAAWLALMSEASRD